MNLSAWVQELKRRRVFRAIATYGIVAFALLQVIEPVMHGLGLPDWILTAVVIGLGLGFPITVLVAWAYDWKPTGLERADEPGPASAGGAAARTWRRLALTAFGLLLAAPVTTYYLAFRAPSRPATAASPPSAPAAPSVAVLPFVNLSDDPGTEYFSDGLSEEILNALAQIPGLRVPARTSSFAFKGKSQDVARIGEALRVSSILEGSVRRAGDRVRVTAQLVNAADGYHVWSQTFDRQLKDVFAIQDEIAAAIAGALQVRLASGGAPSRQPGSTSSAEAYEAYLRGRHALNERTRQAIEASQGHFRRAVEIDPGYAVAWADLAIATLLLQRGQATYGDATPQEALSRARPFIDRARALAPDHPEVLAAAGFAEHEAGREQEALALFDRALVGNPSSELRIWRRMAIENLGRYDEILAAAADAVRVDPLSKLALLNYIPTLQLFGRDQEIAPAVERLQKLDGAWAAWASGWISLGRGERPETVRHFLSAMRQGLDRPAPQLAGVLATLGLREEAAQAFPPGAAKVSMALGDLLRALELARRAARDDPADPETLSDLFGALYASGQAGEAAATAQRLWASGHGDAHHPLSLTFMADAARAAGQVEAAARYRAEAGRRLELFERAGVAPAILAGIRGMLAAFDERDEEAVRFMEAALPIFAGARTDLDQPLFSRLQRRADYLALVKRFEAALARQRAEVDHLLCGPERPAAWPSAPRRCRALAAVR